MIDIIAHATAGDYFHKIRGMYNDRVKFSIREYYPRCRDPAHSLYHCLLLLGNVIFRCPLGVA